MVEHINLGVISLPNYNTLAYIREYNNFLKSIFLKKLKSFTTIGGFTDVVSADSLDKIELTDEICVIINALITKLPFYNVYSGIVMSSLLINLWADPYLNNGIQKTIWAVNELRGVLVASLDLMKRDKVNVDLSYLQSLAISLLLEERSICLDKEALYSFSLSIVKSVLSVTKTEDSLKFGLVGVYHVQGEDTFSSMNGVLCEIDDMNFSLVKLIFSSEPDSYKILLFSESLDVFDDIYILHQISMNDIKVIFCQKKISDTLKIALRRKRVILVDRAGEEVSRSLQLLTDAIPITDYRSLIADELPTMAGLFTNIKPVHDEEKNLILIENMGHNVSFLYVRCRSFSDSTLVKKVVSKSIQLIKSVLSCPFYLPGPVEFENSLIMFVKAHEKDKCNAVREIVAIFVNVLTEITKIYSDCNSEQTDFVLKSDCFILKRNALLHAIDGIINVLSLSRIVRKSS